MRLADPARRALWGSFALALVLRLVRLHEAPKTDTFYDVFLLDSAYYDEMARQILARGPVLDEPFLMAPLYGYFLAGIYAVRTALGQADSPALVYGVQALLGAGTAAISAMLGERLGGRIGAWFAGIAVACYPVAILYDARLLSVTLATFLAVAGALLAQRLWDRLGEVAPTAGRLALATGLVLGLATTARGNLLLALPPLVLLIAVRGGRRRAGLLATAALVVGLSGPLVLSAAHNARAGSPALISVNGGINLYRGNNPWFVDEAATPFRLPAAKDALAKRSQLVASVESDRALSPREADQFWTQRTVATWRSDPVRYGALFVRKLQQTFGWAEIADNVDHAFLIATSAFLPFLPVYHGPVAALGLVGLFLRGRRRDDAPLLVLAAVGALSVALFFVVSRYRLPLFPLWAAYAGAAVAWGWRGARERAWGSLLRVGAATAALGAVLAAPARSPALPWNWLILDADPGCVLDEHTLRAPEIEAAYGLAFHNMLEGHADEALAELKAVVEADPGHGAAGVTLSYLLLQRGDLDGAVQEAARVAQLYPCKEKAWENLGTALLGQGSITGALGALHKAVALDPYDTDLRTALGQAWMKAGSAAEAREALAFAVRWDPANWRARAVLARLDLKEQKVDEAQALLREATRLAPQRPELWGLLGLAALGKGDLPGARLALERGETASARAGGEPDPVLVALRKAFDAPLILPEGATVTVEKRPVGPLAP